MDSGDTASLTCTVHKGDMPIDIDWLHNNETITKTQGVSVWKGRKVSTLNIDSVSQEHAGQYSCLAKNRAGWSTHSAILNVNGIFDFVCMTRNHLLPQIFPFLFIF